MTFTVIRPGMQTTLQAMPFTGYRHLGMPAAGAADCLSFALANRLVGKDRSEAAVEVTLDRAEFVADEPCAIAVTGAASQLRINDKPAALHQTTPIRKGDRLVIDAARSGCRSYLAVSGKLQSEAVLGSQSTYLGARLGGFQGRALKAGDRLDCSNSDQSVPIVRTPENLRPVHGDKYLLRIIAGPEYSVLNEQSRQSLEHVRHRVSMRANRMGLGLTGVNLHTEEMSSMASAAVFPGTIQCPPNGEPILLGSDAQTTGGYPRIAQVIRADRHLIGQLRSNAEVQLLLITTEQAAQIYRQKLVLLKPWLGDISLW
ncbi:biotin-dependent carboxyltransferase family protein [Parasphingorhabdus sp.]|uniref:5-oxoprolinase subunit C family protein n=1 Tax=Parasphingorhabdus sp. TaxID=2709688 RepID=UPI003267A42B